MWGKHYESMYDGSMYGAGVAVFAVWGYIIAHARRGLVELNPRKLADTLGGREEEIVKAIDFLESPDKRSRCKEHEGRRLLKDGEFQYRIPSWAYYQTIRNEEERREYNRKKQAECRAKANGGVGPLPEGLTPAQKKRAEKVRRKIAAEEEIERQVREKLKNKPPSQPPEEGQSTEDEEDLPSEFQ